ncbi:MAG: PhzF family phenazine biosynthesis protein [Geobacteraceae bacterium]|nr:PhzF family phenazine biosynthesis protein [Geobacteraceae bacterium]
MNMPLAIVDAFTDVPFSGNPAGVCLLDGPRPDSWLQSVAREMNLSETAFLLREDEGWRLRWFTPTVEVDLCGHATLACAHLMWQRNLLSAAETACFATRSGLLTASRDGERIMLDFPAEPAMPIDSPVDPAEILGVPCFIAGKNRMDYLVEVPDEETLRGLQPDLAALLRLSCRGMIVTSRPASREFDFVSRFFAPAVGIAEDPVTGSAHCCLGPYWGKKLRKTCMLGRQVSARGGIVAVELAGDRVKLGGRAVTVVQGELLVC